MFCLSSEVLACHLVSRLLSVPRGCHLVFILSFGFQLVFLASKDFKVGQVVDRKSAKVHRHATRETSETAGRHGRHPEDMRKPEADVDLSDTSDDADEA